MKTALLTLALSLLSAPAFADCDHESEQLGVHHVVPAWSYAHVVAMPEASAPFPACEREAEQASCATTDGLECAREMQLTYAACVGEVVCGEFGQLMLEAGECEDEFTPAGLHSFGPCFQALETACYRTVAAAGGEY